MRGYYYWLLLVAIDSRGSMDSARQVLAFTAIQAPVRGRGPTFLSSTDALPAGHYDKKRTRLHSAWTDSLYESERISSSSSSTTSTTTTPRSNPVPAKKGFLGSLLGVDPKPNKKKTDGGQPQSKKAAPSAFDVWQQAVRQTAELATTSLVKTIEKSLVTALIKTSSSSSSSSTTTAPTLAAPTALATEGDWSAYVDDQSTGCVYYYNTKTGAKRWAPPTRTFPVVRVSPKPLIQQDSWAAYLDLAGTGLIYYFNPQLGQSQWVPPTTSFPKVKAVPVPPRPLARQGDWGAYLDTERTGAVYYYNTKTQESQWVPPTDSFPTLGGATVTSSFPPNLPGLDAWLHKLPNWSSSLSMPTWPPASAPTPEASSTKSSSTSSWPDPRPSLNQWMTQLTTTAKSASLPIPPEPTLVKTTTSSKTIAITKGPSPRSWATMMRPNMNAASSIPTNMPVLSRWRQNRDGSITGVISNSKVYNDGSRISTTPITGEVKRGLVVKTISGSRYYLN